MKEKIIDLSPRICKRERKILDIGKNKCIDIDSIEAGDKVWADLGGIELAYGAVYNPKDIGPDGKRVVSFWSYRGWKHIEMAKPEQIVKVKKKR